MTEYEETVALANRILDRPYADPDDDLAMLSRQFLRAVERVDRLRASGAELIDAIGQIRVGNEYPPEAQERVQKAYDNFRAVLAGGGDEVPRMRQ